MSLQVIDVPERQRYEVVRDGRALGLAAYQKTDQLVVFTHTEIHGDDPRNTLSES
ncbi:GNAT family N-acetyltransferase [Micromonospora lutea]|uniref:Uncharacterized protein n=1 Tax=Micromonospora lutea TaxID=419825 RepID=A0ABQ4J2R2_9ACTN|nr:hypothetical protein [Micromonospora lutea]GIJ24477.1 hypothetical protein Vlu01_51010 [Micromonospora lutea]